MQMTPQEIVHELDKYIVGQNKAKKAVAIALRNRWRRAQVAEPLRQEITPKNILMIGPTGVGKTEIARRLARLANAPFIKVEATKFTEVGYVGRDVETIIRDLAEIAVKSGREQAMKAVRTRAEDAAEDRILDVLLPPARGATAVGGASDDESATRQKFRKRLREGALNGKEVEIEMDGPVMQAEIFAPPGMEELTSQIQGMFQNMGSGRKKTRKLRIAEARKLLVDEEAAKLVNDEEIKPSQLFSLFLKASETTAVIMFLVSAAGVSAWLITAADIPGQLAEMVEPFMGNKMLMTFILMVLVMLVGTALDMTPTILIMTPVLMPILRQAGIDPVYFGVLFMINNAIGLVTPPVGTVLNVVCGVVD